MYLLPIPAQIIPVFFHPNAFRKILYSA